MSLSRSPGRLRGVLDGIERRRPLASTIHRSLRVRLEDLGAVEAYDWPAVRLRLSPAGRALMEGA